MDNSLCRLSECKSFQALYGKLSSAIKDFSMEGMLKGGVLVGLSGGADSVMLLHLLLEYRRRNFDFSIVALHVNHGIRGDEAERDLLFCQFLCSELGIEFLSVREDVPAIAERLGQGIEECARGVRYSAFSSALEKREDISFIATAHNADDNAETILLNILRGSGTRGGAGIPPVRDNVIRPLIYCTKSEIVKTLEEAKIAFVTDSTNLSMDYTRNFIRNKVLSGLCERFDDPYGMFSRFSRNLRADDDFILCQAKEFLDTHNPVLNSDLSSLHRSLLLRVLSLMSGVSMSESLFEDIFAMLCKDNFTYCIKNDVFFVCERGICSVRRGKEESREFSFQLQYGVNRFDDFGADVILSETEIPKTSLNVYSFSITRAISSDIIRGEIYIRSRKDGDTVKYGGITRKIKKLFSDNKLSSLVKDRVPLLCDKQGVLWIPGLGSREGGESEKKIFVALCIKNKDLTDRFYSVSEFRS